MKQRSLRLVFASAGTLAVLALSAHADIVIMKDGKKYENANIVSETADSVTFKYMLTPRIPDTRTEKKADVAQLIKQRPEELEIVPLRKLLPSADLLTADKYEALIQDQLRPFIAKYPGTAEAKEIEGMIATLQTEKEKVVSGQMKMDGEWLTAEVVKRDSHVIDSFRIRREMNDFAAKNNWLEALRTWDKLSARDGGYNDTEHYVKAIPEVSKVLEIYKKELEKMLALQPGLQKAREDSMKALVEPDLTRTKRAIDGDIQKFKDQNEIEKKMKQRWMTVYKYDGKAIQAAQKVVVDERTKIATLDVNRLSATVQSITAARRYLADSNVEQAESALKQASDNLGRDNSLTTVISRLKSDVTKLKMEMTKKRATQKITGTPGATNSGAATSTTDDRVRKAIEDAEKAKADKKEAKEPSGGGLNSLNASSTTNGSKSSAESDDKKAKKPARKSTAVAADADEGGFQKYALWGGLGLLVVLLSAMFLQKRK